MAKKDAGSTEALKNLVIEAILDKKGQDVVSLDLRDIHDTVSDYFIIAHGDSSTQVNAIFQSVMDSAKAADQRPYHSEGMKNGEWVIIDFVDVVAHIFYRERRDFYMLEELWSDAKITKHDPESAIKPKSTRQPMKKAARATAKSELPYMDDDDDDDVVPVRKAPVRKTAAKKAAAPKKAPAKKIAAKKVAAKKAPAKKTATKKTITKKSK